MIEILPAEAGGWLELFSGSLDAQQHVARHAAPDDARRAQRAAARAPTKSLARRAAATSAQGMGLVSVDALGLSSPAALVLDQTTQEVLYEKNAGAVLPIASITKLMTAMVVLDSGAPMSELIEVERSDFDLYKGTGSRLAPGARLEREELLHLALMASENRAAHALARSHPGGFDAFVRAMNERAASLGMSATRFVEPTGLSSENRSSSQDLARMTAAAYAYPRIREFSTSENATVEAGRKSLEFRTTNRLVRDPSWEIGLQKTGFIAQAGRCLVMQAVVAGRAVIMVLLAAEGAAARAADADRIGRWLGGSGQPRAVVHAGPALGSHRDPGTLAPAAELR